MHPGNRGYALMLRGILKGLSGLRIRIIPMGLLIISMFSCNGSQDDNISDNAKILYAIARDNETQITVNIIRMIKVQEVTIGQMRINSEYPAIVLDLEQLLLKQVLILEELLHETQKIKRRSDIHNEVKRWHDSTAGLYTEVTCWKE